MNDVLTIVAHTRAKPGRESDALEMLRGLIEPTRAEAGCINYDLHQSADDPALFVFYENWASEKDFEAHGRSAHIQKFRQCAATCLAEGPLISKWKIVP